MAHVIFRRLIRKGFTLSTFFMVLFSGFLISNGHSAEVSLTWVIPSDTSMIDGYKIYYRLSDSTYSSSLCKVVSDPDKNTCSVSGLSEGLIYGFVATSYNSEGMESSPSNEVFYSVPASGTNQDSDHDGLTDSEENNTYMTDPIKADTDEDGLKDGDEVEYWGSNEWDQDYDGDGMCNLLDPDADNDGISDGEEIANGTDPATKDIPPSLIPQSQMSIASVDSEELRGEDGAANNAIDGKVNTIWHTQWYDSNPKHPHEIVINLGESYDVLSLSYLPRQDGSENGMIANYKIYVSLDGSSWGKPVATGVWNDSLRRKDVALTAKTGQFVKLVADSEVNGNIWSSAAELYVTGNEANSSGGSSGDSPDQEAIEIPQSSMSIVGTDSEELIGEDGSVDNVLDGDEWTIWHTQWYGSSPQHPHEVIIDLGSSYDVQGLSYLPRQDDHENGMIAGYAIYVSQDGSNWGNPVRTGTWSDTKEEKTVFFEGTPGRYVMLVAISDVNGHAWSSAAEINIIGAAVY